MKSSIRLKFTLILVAVIAGVIAAICFINDRYLEVYVLDQKQDKIETMREAVEAFVDSGYQEEEGRTLDRLSRIDLFAAMQQLTE